ncbi:S-methyl-5-thioribose-1-phosphate isomerase [bacterium]|nr:S-methyl-5-thioribose-1-phosphate isomerase [candidate division CSSED10-310 bacterium]
MVQTIEWKNDTVVMIDQRVLPLETRYQVYTTYQEVAGAIRAMVIRGAPAIGVAAAMGIALGARQIRHLNGTRWSEAFEEILRTISATRPTAVNLFWAVDRMRRLTEDMGTQSPETIADRLVAEARLILEEDVACNRAMGRCGQELLPDGATVLTHCNAGALATGGYGTALGVIRAAVEAGKRIQVFADETRPFLQGARLTSWELMEDGIPVTLITDNMAGWLMRQGQIDAIVVGADRIAANGDAANKIGTYSVAILAAHHRLPFYVAAPMSTIDFSLADGTLIPIEERDDREVTHVFGTRIAPPGIPVRNPAFDVTPASHITAIITEKGIARPPFQESLRALSR